MTSLRRPSRFLLAAFLAVCSVRAGLAWRALETRGYSYPDSQEYVALAESLLAGEGFTRGGRPETKWTPGYPLLLGALGAVTGDHIVLAALAVQVLAVSGIALWLSRVLPGMAGSSRSAAALVVAFTLDPVSLGLSTALLSETLFMALAAVRLALLLVPSTRGTLTGAGLGGLVTGFMALVRPIASYLVVADVLCLLTTDRRRRLHRCSFALLGFLIALAPWLIRNHSLGVSGLTSNAGWQLLRWNAAIVEAHARPARLAEVQAEFRSLHGATPTPAIEALGVFAARPWATVVVTMKSALLFFADPGHHVVMRPLGLRGSGLLSGNQTGDRTLALSVLAICVAWHLGLFVAVVRGARWLSVSDPVAIIVCAVTTAYFVLFSLHINLAEGARFRAPIVPVLAYVAAMGLTRRTSGSGAASSRGESLRRPLSKRTAGLDGAATRREMATGEFSLGGWSANQWVPGTPFVIAASPEPSLPVALDIQRRNSFAP